MEGIINIRKDTTAIQFMMDKINEVKDFVGGEIEILGDKIKLKNNKIVQETDYIIKDNNGLYVLTNDIFTTLYLKN